MSKAIKRSDCGYLCKHYYSAEWRGGGKYVISEISLDTRLDPSKIRLQTSDELYCYRRSFILGKVVEDSLKKSNNAFNAIQRVIEQPRDCKYHLRYVSGYSPEQHLTRWESLERESINRRWSLVYIVIGSIITVLGALAIKLIWG